MKIYPVPGRIVRDPANGRELTDPEGIDVSESDSFWIRRLADEDVTKTKPKAVKPAAGGDQ